MNTREMLEKLPDNHKAYLKRLKADISTAQEKGQTDLVKEYRAVARGYIRCLVECSIVADFKKLWIWFTIPTIIISKGAKA